ncbi:hypothetical protein [Maridesulfovibrio sp.]|uniref:hypothetical protein n=1 Tax=Maridesulfovibrio sp. TaxID=2795000 RepID=UPI002A18787F|nr:hypothetical protein [Maridesulfovibrio sp.]
MDFNLRIGSEQVQSYTSPSVNVKNVEKDEEEQTSLSTGTSGDTVEISDTAKSLLAQSKSADQTSDTESSEESEDSSSSQQEEMISRLKEQIEKLQQEIEKLKQSPEENKEQISAKENELMQIQGQLTELLEQQAKSSGTSIGGGTRAQGFSNSLT